MGRHRAWVRMEWWVDQHPVSLHPPTQPGEYLICLSWQNLSLLCNFSSDAIFQPLGSSLGSSQFNWIAEKLIINHYENIFREIVFFLQLFQIFRNVPQDCEWVVGTYHHAPPGRLFWPKLEMPPQSSHRNWEALEEQTAHCISTQLSGLLTGWGSPF